jgi:hypothetical protein
MPGALRIRAAETWRCQMDSNVFIIIVVAGGRIALTVAGVIYLLITPAPGTGSQRP